MTIQGYAQAAPSPGAKAAPARPGCCRGSSPIHDVYPRGSSSTLSATYASEGTRESALAVSHAVQYHAHRRVELPAGATVVRTPGPFGVETHALTASRKLGVTAGTAPAIEDDVTLEVPTGTIPAAAYAAFVADAHRTDDAFLATILVRTPPARLRHAEGGRCAPRPSASSLEPPVRCDYRPAPRFPVVHSRAPGNPAHPTRDNP